MANKGWPKGKKRGPRKKPVEVFTPEEVGADNAGPAGIEDQADATERVNPITAKEKSDAVSRVSRGFEEQLATLDKDRGWSLTGIWRDCLKLHDNNAIARQNVAQMQVMVQQHMIEWAQGRKGLGLQLDSLNPQDADYKEKYAHILILCEKSSKLVTDVMKTINQNIKEIRQTEFQSKFYFHVNLVLQYTMGVTAVLNKHLSRNPALLAAVLEDMRDLVKLFKFQEGEDQGGGMRDER